MRIGFIGLGHLGRAIAGRLSDCEHTLKVWNRSPGKAEGMEVEVVHSPVAVVDETDIVIMCLFDSAAVRQVLTMEDFGILAGNVTGRIIIDLTTNHFSQVMDFHALCRKAGASYLEAPVLGSVIPASQGALTVLASGDKSAFEKAQPVLEDIGKNIFYLEEPSSATKMKLINNLTLASFMATLAEATVFGEKVGLKKEDILDILSVGGGSSLVLNAKKDKLIAEDFTTHFSNALMAKDLHCLQDMASANQHPLSIGTVIKELYDKACESGDKQADFSSIYKLFQEK